MRFNFGEGFKLGLEKVYVMGKGGEREREEREREFPYSLSQPVHLSSDSQRVKSVILAWLLNFAFRTKPNWSINFLASTDSLILMLLLPARQLSPDSLEWMSEKVDAETRARLN